MFQIFAVLAGKAAVFGKLCRVKINVAIGNISKSLVFQIFDKVNHLLYMFGCPADDRRTGKPQFSGMAEESILIHSGYFKNTLFFAFGRNLHFVFALVAVARQMPDVGYIHHMFDFVAGQFQRIHQQIFKNISAEIADMRIIIYGRATAIHRYQRRI